MFYWQLPPFLLFGIYWTFIHYPLFRSKVPENDYEELEDPKILRVKRKIDIKWGLRCLVALLFWTAFIVGIVVLLVKSEKNSGHTVKRWVADSLWETWRPIYYG
jgi:hypothetical protein